MEFANKVCERTSVRAFEPGKVAKKAEIETILKAGMSAPTACGAKPWHFVVVNDKEILLSLAAGLPYCKFAKDCAFAIVVCGDKHHMLKGEDRDYWIQDCSAATQNMLLVGNAFGYGSTWTATFPYKERIEVVAKSLKLPENLIPLNVVPFGVPTKAPQNKDRWDPSLVHYNSF